MNTATLPPPEATAYRNYYRLFMLRNAEILCVGLGIVIAMAFFELELPLQKLLIILGLIAGLNLYTWLRLRTGSTFGNPEIFVLMLLDVAVLTAVFFYTGGASNPFVWFYLLPLMIAATILPRWHTWTMAAITVLCYSSLFLTSAHDMSEHAHHGAGTGFQMHVFGMWLGFVMSAGFVAVIIVGMAHSLRERDQKLAEAREQVLRNERLVELGTLAAGTAHELGTPLGTMAILASELEQEYSESDDTGLTHRLGILRRQIDRCKQTLSSLSSAAGAQRAESGHAMAVQDYLDEVTSEWHSQRPGTRLQLEIDASGKPGRIIAERTLSQALINILNNAADASPENVILHAHWSATELELDISDRGPGLSDEIHSQLGKQPVTTKQEGLGVGLYLAHATIQRLGGSLSIRKRNEGSGTTLTITLPLLIAPQDG
jgi:two-component system, sensor histidine kinase RegB